jgi:hypothetical protein
MTVHAARLLTVAASLVLLAPAVSAQITFDPRIDQRRDNCGAVGASRTRSRARCEPERTEPEPAAAATTQKDLTVRIELPEVARLQCEATAATEYQQRNTVARVNATISVTGCGPASGALTVVARLRDAAGEVKSLEFPETWQRGDDRDIRLSGDYPIGEDVDLVNVRVRGLSCTCAETPAAQAETSAADAALPE